MLVSNLILGRYSALPKWRDTFYQLQVTNLDDVEIEFEIKCHVLRNSGENWVVDHLRGDFNDFNVQNTVITPFRWDGRSYSNSTRAIIRPHVCGLFTLRVYPPQEKQFSGDRDYELTGFVELSVPRRRPPGEFRLGPQVSHPVPVLLNARKVDYRLPDRVPASDRPVWSMIDGFVDFGFTLEGDNYSSEGIALAGGKAEALIEPDGALRFGVVNGIAAIRAAMNDGKQDGLSGARGLPEAERAAALLDLLLDLSTAPGQYVAINDFLRDSGSRLRLERDPNPTPDAPVSDAPTSDDPATEPD